LVCLAASTLFLGAALSTTATDDPRTTGLTLVFALLAPAALFAAVVWSALPARPLVAGFLLAAAAGALRADAVFFLNHGLPTPDVLRTVKSTSEPYDFGYYLFDNPNHASAFLVFPLAITVFALWDSRGRERWALAILFALFSVTSVLVYDRSILVVVLLVSVALAALSPLSRRARASIVALLLMIPVIALAVPSTRSYLVREISSRPRLITSSVQTQSVTERATSTLRALRVMADDPLTGVGLGRYGVAPVQIPAHSSIGQAAAAMGVAGFLGLILLTVAVLAVARRTVRAAGWVGLRPAVALACALYVVLMAVVGGADSALFNGYNSVWGLSLAALLGLACRELGSQVPDGSPRALLPARVRHVS
jgi:hypothetical protein